MTRWQRPTLLQTSLEVRQVRVERGCFQSIPRAWAGLDAKGIPEQCQLNNPYIQTILLRVSLSRLGGKHWQLARQVGDSASSMATFAFSTMTPPGGATFIFGSWVSVCKHLGPQGMFRWLMTTIIVTNEYVQLNRSLSLIWSYVKRGPSISLFKKAISVFNSRLLQD